MNKIVISIVILFAVVTQGSTSIARKIGPEYGSLRFGIVVDNPKYTIYRSKRLGDSGLEKLYDYLRENSLPFPNTIIHMNKQGYKFPSYSALEEYELQEEYGFKFIHTFGEYSTYVDGYNPIYPEQRIVPRKYLGSKARQYFNPSEDPIIGGLDKVDRVLQFTFDRENQPVLFHCFGGRHRTGMISLIIRHIQGGKWLADSGKTKRGMDLNLAEYEYYKFNRLLFRKDNIRFIREFKTTPLFKYYRDKYHKDLQSW